LDLNSGAVHSIELVGADWGIHGDKRPSMER
jgi:hypothetical protein